MGVAAGGEAAGLVMAAALRNPPSGRNNCRFHRQPAFYLSLTCPKGEVNAEVNADGNLAILPKQVFDLVSGALRGLRYLGGCLSRHLSRQMWQAKRRLNPAPLRA